MVIIDLLLSTKLHPAIIYNMNVYVCAMHCTRHALYAVSIVLSYCVNVSARGVLDSYNNTI